MMLSSDRKGAKFSIATVFRTAIFAILLGVIFSKLAGFGVANILQNLPSQPLYYVLSLALYFILPGSELLIYGRLWKTSVRKLCIPMIRKRTLNEGVLGYSGEAYLVMWARKELELPINKILSVVKDNNIISSFASWSLTIALLIIVLVAMQDRVDVDFGVIRGKLVFFVLIGIGLLAVVYSLKHLILSLYGTLLKQVAIIHFTRLALAMLFQVVMWSIVLPGVPVLNWLAVLAAYFLVSRIPFLPSYDLVLLGLGISMAGFIGASEAAVAGLFVAGAALSQGMNLFMFLATSVFQFTLDVEIVDKLMDSKR